MFDQSPTIAALAKALSAAQGEIEGAVKGKNNPAFRSKYADLSAVWDACREALSKNGLSVIQSPGPCADGRMEMTTVLAHASGEWMRGTLTIPLGKVDAQAYGSATTYARRYALAAFVGVAPEDDDGNAASASAPKASPRSEPTASASGRKTPAQAKRDGDHERLNAEIDRLTLDGLADWFANFDRYTADQPIQWLDPIRDRLELRRQELMGKPSPADAMDEGYRAAVGGAA
ncbi:MAG: ERF family protein [Phenylobacterium sp.]|nr:ERF family protein [Phenylobacterium sp.]